MIVVGATSGCQGCRTGRQIIIATESTHTGGGEICQRATDERCCLVTSRLALQQKSYYSLNMIDDNTCDEIDDDDFDNMLGPPKRPRRPQRTPTSLKHHNLFERRSRVPVVYPNPYPNLPKRPRRPKLTPTDPISTDPTCLKDPNLFKSHGYL